MAHFPLQHKVKITYDYHPALSHTDPWNFYNRMQDRIANNQLKYLERRGFLGENCEKYVQNYQPR